MKKLLVLACLPIIYYGGYALALLFFSPLKEGDEIIIACMIFVGTVLWFLGKVIERLAYESSMIRLAEYEERRDRRFREIESGNFASRYEICSQISPERRNHL